MVGTCTATQEHVTVFVWLLRSRIQAYTRVLSVRGRTGAVIGLEPAAGESSQDISMCLTKCLPEAGLLQVEHIASDSPSTKLFRALKEICINLEGLSLDPTHAAMRYEQALGGKKSRGSHLLRSFMTKFTTHDPAVTSNILGPWYQGGAAPPLTAQEQALRHHIQERSFSKIRASKVLFAAEKLVAWMLKKWIGFSTTFGTVKVFNPRFACFCHRAQHPMRRSMPR